MRQHRRPSDRSGAAAGENNRGHVVRPGRSPPGEARGAKRAAIAARELLQRADLESTSSRNTVPGSRLSFIFSRNCPRRNYRANPHRCQVAWRMFSSPAVKFRLTAVLPASATPRFASAPPTLTAAALRYCAHWRVAIDPVAASRMRRGQRAAEGELFPGGIRQREPVQFRRAARTNRCGSVASALFRMLRRRASAAPGPSGTSSARDRARDRLADADRHAMPQPQTVRPCVLSAWPHRPSR